MKNCNILNAMVCKRNGQKKRLLQINLKLYPQDETECKIMKTAENAPINVV